MCIFCYLDTESTRDIVISALNRAAEKMPDDRRKIMDHSTLCGRFSVAREHYGNPHPIVEKIQAYDRKQTYSALYSAGCDGPADALDYFGIQADGEELPFIAPVLAWARARWFELPTLSSDGRLAYFRDLRGWGQDIRTVTTPAKWLSRVRPDIPGHVIEQICDGSADRCEVIRDMAGMLAIMRESGQTPGLSSCMAGSASDFDGMIHPYEVYDSRLGWGLAISRDAWGTLVARGLVWQNPDDPNEKGFVRLYGASNKQTIRGDHAGLRYWLESQGYDHFADWSDCLIAQIESRNGHGYIAPYIDGDSYGLKSAGQHPTVGPVWRITDYGEPARETTGLLFDHEGQVQTEDGDWIDEDDATYIEGYGYVHMDNTAYDDINDEPIHVDDAIYLDYRSETTHRDNCVRAYTRPGRWALVYREDTIELHNGTIALFFDNESEHVVELENGDFAWFDDAVCIEDYYYLPDDPRVSYNDAIGAYEVGHA